MRVLVTGARGMLGQDLVAELESRDIEVLATDREELDLLSATALQSLADKKLGTFDWVMNCAAYTAVDKAEEEITLATRLNGFTPGLLASATAAMGGRLLHISTDFVFDGLATSPYHEDAPTNPQSVYGRTKRQGEVQVFAGQAEAVVCRTAWLYGAKGKSFPKTMIGAWLAGKSLRVVADQVGCPTYTVDLSRVLVDLAQAKVPGGIYHTTGPDTMNWHAFASLAIEAYRDVHGLGGDVAIEPIKTSDWPTPAKRPPYSALSFDKVASRGALPMRHVSESLTDFAVALGHPLS